MVEIAENAMVEFLLPADRHRDSSLLDSFYPLRSLLSGIRTTYRGNDTQAKL